MKRSKNIHLVLVTAALASNRMIIPADPSAPFAPDTSLTAAPLHIDSTGIRD